MAMPPLYRIDIGKHVFYALDEARKGHPADRIERDKIRDSQRHALQGTGRNEPIAAARIDHASDTRRLVQLTIDDIAETTRLMDMLLSKKRAPDRKRGWKPKAIWPRWRFNRSTIDLYRIPIRCQQTTKQLTEPTRMDSSGATGSNPANGLAFGLITGVVVHPDAGA